ncbi:phosphoadenosine phosphosulfate reductase domain-containing protein [Marinobacter sp. MBR-105]|jgi:3'-phosphoadenosine 5'-phosphosulfate sulfotransferase (PAPS reductase)/FAD synthetase
MSQQIALFDITEPATVAFGTPDLDTYDFVVVFFSGGKDSVAAVLDLLDRGVPRDKIELHHHRVDGAEGSDLFDWPVTDAYVAAFAKAFGLKLYFSWKEGGLEGEMLRNNELTKPAWFTTPDGELVKSGGESGKLGTRLKFPAVTASLQSRWCSAYGKIDIGSKVITGQTRFCGKRTLVITGERAQESAARAKYETFMPHRADRRNGRLARHVDHWRSVHSWDETRVWEIIEKYKVRAHPAYFLGFGRCSCQFCIFGSKDQWATVRHISPKRFARIANYERMFNHTIQNGKSVIEMADQGTVYAAATPERAEIALSTEYSLPIIMDTWEQPAGAYGENAGPM